MTLVPRKLDMGDDAEAYALEHEGEPHDWKAFSESFERVELIEIPQPEYEWGIFCVPTNEIHRTGMTEDEARDWIRDWVQSSGRAGFFKLVRRPLGGWERVE